MIALIEKYKEVVKNLKQREAVDSEENVVVIAGPGSGKTRIATLKAGIEVSKQHRVACISYSRVAAHKMRQEFLLYDVPENNIFFGTVHSFCIYYIVRRYLHLYKDLLPQPWNLLPETWCIPTQEKIVSQIGSQEINTNNFHLRDSRYARYESSLNNDIAAQDNLNRYDYEMITSGFLDFEMIAELCLIMLTEINGLYEALSRHFDWIIIDEYQDLGVIFHKIITNLSEHSNIRFMVVGDPDQAIHDENGGRYITELNTDSGFNLVKTEYCYRYNQRIVDKSSQILSKENTYIAAETTYALGDIILRPINPAKTFQEEELAEYLVNKLLLEILYRNSDISLGDICILYPQRRNDRMADLLIEELNKLKQYVPDFDFVDERGIQQLPNTPLIEWLQECADWCFSDILTRSGTLTSLAEYYENLYGALGRVLDENETRQFKLIIRELLNRLRNENISCADWVSQLVTELHIEQLIAKIGDPGGELDELKKLYEYTNYPPQLLATGYNAGKLVLTTIHSSKGRQFKYVFVVGMQLGLVPWADWNGQPVQVPRFQKLAYVACTRSSHQTYIVVSPYIRSGISPFINHITA